MSDDDPMSVYGEYLDKYGLQVGPSLLRTFADDDETSFDESEFMMACQVCDTALNRLTNAATAEIAWVHAKAWKRYDHDPVPTEVPRPLLHTRTDLLCDFCGVNTTLKWSYVGSRLQHVSGNFGNDMGNIWGACQECSELIDQRDAVGTVQRCMTKSSLARETPDSHKPAVAQELIAMHQQFMSTIREKRYVGPPIVSTVITAKLMPKVQQSMTRFWGHPDRYASLIRPGFNVSVPGVHAQRDDTFAAQYYDGAVMPQEVFERHAAHQNLGVQAAQLYWVSADFTRLATLAGLDLTEIGLRRDHLPAANGLIVWQTPVGEIQRPYGVAAIRAMGWTLVPGGVWINVYIQPEDANPEITDVAALRAEHGWLVSPNNGSGIPFVEPWGTVDSDFQQQGNFLLTLIATWYLLRQPGVAEQTPAPVDKKIARAYQRNTGRRIPEVTLIDLRKRPKVERKPGEKKSWELKYKRYTSGHWRNQWYPSRGEHDQIYISPYLAGADKPWRPGDDSTPTVKVLR